MLLLKSVSFADFRMVNPWNIGDSSYIVPYMIHSFLSMLEQVWNSLLVWHDAYYPQNICQASWNQ